jgi:hypothetical protein
MLQNNASKTLQDLNIFDYGPKQWKVQNDNKILKVVN